MRIERALATSLANIPNTLVLGLKFGGLRMSGHISSVPSGTEDGPSTTYVYDETARADLAETSAWRIQPPPGSESLSRKYDVVLPLVAAAATGGTPKPGGGVPPGAAFAETKEPVAVLGAQAQGPTVVEEGLPPQGMIYRGLHADHPAMPAAMEGRVEPANIQGKTTPELHNAGIGIEDSPNTAWTHDLRIAVTRRDLKGPGGVILAVPKGAPPQGATWAWEWSPDEFGESEVFMTGVRSGVRVFR
jgi:hypothetical protein